MTIHTSTYKGKRLYIVLKNGKKFVDKFIDKKSGYVLTETYGKIKKSDIKTMTNYRNPTQDIVPPKQGGEALSE